MVAIISGQSLTEHNQQLRLVETITGMGAASNKWTEVEHGRI